ncbi:MAG: HEAT repeat domain-containing protein [bacterium]
MRISSLLSALLFASGAAAGVQGQQPASSAGVGVSRGSGKSASAGESRSVDDAVVMAKTIYGQDAWSKAAAYGVKDGYPAAVSIGTSYGTASTMNNDARAALTDAATAGWVASAMDRNASDFGEGTQYRSPVPAPVFPPLSASHSADPADSLYRLARAALDDGDFRRAATLFATVADKYPDSTIASDALYYRAYALYRSGTSSRELDEAVRAIDRQAVRYPKAGTLSDAKQLRASILAEQAKRGDSRAGQEIAQGANTLKNQNGCPTDDDEMRLAALAGIIQIDPDQVLPVLQKVLARKDECSVKLRQRAVLMVAQTKEEERADILLSAARTDPSIEVRRDAVINLARVNTERAAKALDSILVNATDPEIRERALSALSQHTSPTARIALRHFAEQTTVSTEMRVRAVSYMANGRKNGDESEYFHTLFNKTASPDIREAIIRAIANQRTPDRTSWLLGVARDKNYEIDVRKQALFYAGQTNPDLKDLLPLYDEFAGQVEMQDQMLYVYQQRKETEATDKLLQIAKTEKNPELRKSVIRWLGTRKDPRVKQFLIDLISQ